MKLFLLCPRFLHRIVPAFLCIALLIHIAAPILIGNFFFWAVRRDDFAVANRLIINSRIGDTSSDNLFLVTHSGVILTWRGILTGRHPVGLVDGRYGQRFTATSYGILAESTPDCR